jgi:hypothetical protein
MNRSLGLVAFMLTIIVGAVVPAGWSHAAIILESSGNGTLEPSGLGPVVVTPFVVNLANASDALAVMVSSESVSTLAASFNGTAMTKVSTALGGSAQYADIFFVNNPGVTSGNLEITGTSTTSNTGGLAWSWFDLSGVDSIAATFTNAQAGSTPAGGILTANYTTVNPGGFILANAVDNAAGDSTTPLWQSGNASTTELRVYQAGGGVGHTMQYGSVSAAGSYGETFSQFNSRSAIAILPLEAAAVPEPATTFGLVAAAGVGATFLRRKVTSSKG